MFFVGQHDDLEHAADDLQTGDEFLAYLDDLYVISVAGRAKAGPGPCHVSGPGTLRHRVGKTHVYNAGCGEPPPSVSELGDDAWHSGRPTHDAGLPRWVSHTGPPRLRTRLPVVQCAWHLRFMCASTRANFRKKDAMSRPRSSVRMLRRDWALCTTLLWACAGESTDGPLTSTTWAVATLPAALKRTQKARSKNPSPKGREELHQVVPEDSYPLASTD